jgi:hypothetical protein
VLTLALVSAGSWGESTYRQIQAAFAIEQAYAGQGETLSQLQQENQALEEKLQKSAKTITPASTKELVRFYIRKHFPQNEWARAEQVFTCESGLNPQSAGTNQVGAHKGSIDRGVAQVNDKFHKARFEKMYGIPFEVGAHDIELNLRYARYLYDHSGWGPWVCRKVL